MKLTTSLIALLLALWSTSMILASEKVREAGREDRKGAKHKGPIGDVKGGARSKNRGDVFRKLDLDQNGIISFDEFSKAERLMLLEEDKRRKLFNFLDHNKDGDLQNIELMPRERHWLDSLKKNLSKLDTDQDGKLSFVEFSKAKFNSDKAEAEQREIFNKLDKDQSEKIDSSELNNRVRRQIKPDFDFKKHDLDQSGGLNYSEYSSLPFVDRFPEDRKRANFARMDVNADGEVSEDEIGAAHQRRSNRGSLDQGLRGKRSGKRENNSKSTES